MGLGGAAAPAVAAAAASAALSFASFTTPPAAAAAAAPAPAVALLPQCALDPGAFQAKWGALGAGQQLQLQCRARMPSVEEVSAAARAAHLQTMASGDTGAALKLFLFGADSAGGFHCLEVLVDKQSGRVGVTLKSDLPQHAALAAQAATQAFAGF